MSFKKVLYSLSALLCISCTGEQLREQASSGDSVTFSASFNETKTELSGNSVLWQEGDRINVISGTQASVYEQTGLSQDRKIAKFNGPAMSGECYALYPAQYSAGACDALDASSLTVELPAEQKPVADSFDPAANLAVTKIEGSSLVFRNVCGLVSVQFNNPDIKAVHLSTREVNGGNICGKGIVDWNSGTPSVDSSGGSDCVEIKGNIESGKRYCFAVYPGTYDDMVMIVIRSDGKAATLPHAGQLVVKRNNIHNISAITIAEDQWKDNVFAALLRATESTLSVAWTTGNSQLSYFDCPWPCATPEYDPTEDIKDDYKVELYSDSACSQMVVGYKIGEYYSSAGTASGRVFTDVLPTRFCFTGLTPNTDYWLKVRNINKNLELGAPFHLRTSRPAFEGTVVTSGAKAGDVILFEDFRKIIFTGDMSTFSAGYSRYDRNKVTSVSASMAKGDEPYNKDSNIYLVRANVGIGLFNTLGKIVPDMGLGQWGWFAQDNTAGCINSCGGYIKIGANSKHAALVTPALSAIPGDYLAKVKVSFKACPYTGDPTIDERENEIRVDHIGLSDFSQSSYMVSGRDVRESVNMTLENKLAWKEYSVQFDNVTALSRISFEGCGSAAQSRFNIDDVKVEVLEIRQQDTPVYPDMPTPDPSSTVFGLVKCGDQPVKDVIVTDGYLFTTTSAEGFYELPSAKETGLVYITTPSGYICPLNGTQPEFFHKTTRGLKQRFDFQLINDGDQTNHEVLILGDIHTSLRAKDYQFETTISEINQYVADNPGKKIYVATLGDMINNERLYTTSSYQGFGPQEFLNYVAKLMHGYPVYYSMGNHDSDFKTSVVGASEGWDMVDLDVNKVFFKAMGPTCYSFNIGNVHYISLDSILSQCTTGGVYSTDFKYTERISGPQMAWLKKDLSYVSTDTPVVLLMHAPIYDASGTIHAGGDCLENGVELVEALHDYKVTAFTAHTHLNWVTKRTSISDYNTGSVCGCFWWSGIHFPTLNMSQDGGMSGYRVIDFEGKTMTDNYFKCTGRSRDYQFRTYDRNQINITPELAGLTVNKDVFNKKITDYGAYNTVSSENLVYINVWDYNDDWTISVKENGKALKVRRANVYDPLFNLTYYGGCLMDASSTGQNAVIVSHMFYVTASSANSTLNIKITDDHGHTYSETMTRPKAFNIDMYK